jgi:hypothetical protein
MPPLLLSRRSFFAGLFAPAIVRTGLIMPISVWPKRSSALADFWRYQLRRRGLIDHPDMPTMVWAQRSHEEMLADVREMAGVLGFVAVAPPKLIVPAWLMSAQGGPP